MKIIVTACMEVFAKAIGVLIVFNFTPNLLW